MTAGRRPDPKTPAVPTGSSWDCSGGRLIHHLIFGPWKNNPFGYKLVIMVPVLQMRFGLWYHIPALYYSIQVCCHTPHHLSVTLTGQFVPSRNLAPHTQVLQNHAHLLTFLLLTLSHQISCGVLSGLLTRSLNKNFWDPCVQVSAIWESTCSKIPRSLYIKC